MTVISKSAANSRAVVIRDETAESANTADRVGSLLDDMIDSMWPSSAVAIHIADVETNPHAVSVATLVEGTLTDLNGAISDANIYSTTEVDNLLDGYVPISRTLTTTAPLAGGGSLSANRTLSISNASTSAVGVVRLTADLGGSGTSPTVLRINGATVPTAGALTVGHVLRVTGVAALAYGLITASNISATAAIEATQIEAGGDNNVFLGGATSNSWGQITNARVASGAAIAVNKLAAGTDGYALTTVAGVPAWAARSATDYASFLMLDGTRAMSGDFDVGGHAITNVGLVDGFDVSTSVPNTRTLTTTAPLAGGGNLTADRTLSIANASTSAVGVVRLTDDLGGSGASPKVIRINGATVPAAGALTVGHVLRVTGVAALTYGLITNDNVAVGAAVAVDKLAAGSVNQVLTTVAGVAAWAARSDADYTSFLMLNGTRAMTGSLNMGAYSITNIGTVDGVDVSDHSGRHGPDGDDALAIGNPVAVGATLSAGTANSYSRSNHVHSHGDHLGGTLHAGATTSVAGFVTLAGDISGTATSVSVRRIYGATVPASGALTTNHVLRVTGPAALGYGLLTSANISATAGIAATQLDTGAANTVLWSNGTVNLMTTTPIVGSVQATSHLSVGSSLPTIGSVRLAFGSDVYMRSYEGADVSLVTVQDTTGNVSFGSMTAPRSGALYTYINAPAEVRIAPGPSSTVMFTASDSTFSHGARNTVITDGDVRSYGFTAQSDGTVPDAPSNGQRLFSNGSELVARNVAGSYWELSPDDENSNYPSVRFVKTGVRRAFTTTRTVTLALTELIPYLTATTGFIATFAIEVTTVLRSSTIGSHCRKRGGTMIVAYNGTQWGVDILTPTSPAIGDSEDGKFRVIYENSSLVHLTWNASSYYSSSPSLRFTLQAAGTTTTWFQIVVTGSGASV
jgi:hypothetical protein